jgi:hypothetical protein
VTSVDWKKDDKYYYLNINIEAEGKSGSGQPFKFVLKSKEEVERLLLYLSKLYQSLFQVSLSINDNAQIK